MNHKDLNKSEQQNPSVLGTGLIALDIVINTEHNREPFFQAGGTCGNVLSILSFLGWDSYPIARLNGDTASKRVTDDFERWNLHLDYASTEPRVETPVIVHTISRNATGEPRHKFSFNCPRCGKWLPSYKPVLSKVANQIASEAPKHNVFFFDRVSRASITLAQASAEQEAIVFFEPVSIPDARLFKEALSVTHILKYSSERFTESPVDKVKGSMPLLEIQTLGDKGLRYRSRLAGLNENVWQYLKSCQIRKTKDTAGAGDWCSAGIIDSIGRNGLEILKGISIESLNGSLKLGQKLGAWNCQFEGARGGMYQSSKEETELLLEDIIVDNKIGDLMNFKFRGKKTERDFSLENPVFMYEFKGNNFGKEKVEKRSCCFFI